MDFAKLLLKWNSRDNYRKMPWKGEKDPYKIWLSEIILQQTRVDQGWNYYEKFIAAYPDVVALANAADEEVMKLWEGLGYYSRCRNLMHTAREIAFGRGGKFPQTSSELKKLKGVGDYTAAAIASFAYREPVAVVDGNVQRILARVYNIHTPVDTPEGKKLFIAKANELLSKESPDIFNQAIMDFGATVCLPRNPLCGNCVFNRYCKANLLSVQHQLPVKSKKLNRKTRWLNYFLIRYGDEILIRKRTGKDIWKDLFEFVLFETPQLPKQSEIDDFIKSHFGNHAVLQPSRIEKKQQLTHQTIKGTFLHVILNKKTPLNGYHFEKIDNLNTIPFPGLINSYLTDKPLPKTQTEE